MKEITPVLQRERFIPKESEKKYLEDSKNQLFPVRHDYIQKSLSHYYYHYFSATGTVSV